MARNRVSVVPMNYWDVFSFCGAPAFDVAGLTRAVVRSVRLSRAAANQCNGADSKACRYAALIFLVSASASVLNAADMPCTRSG